MQPVLDTLQFLLGTWEINRLLRDHRSAAEGSFNGTAILRPTLDRDLRDGRATYYEIGELDFGDHRGQARRTLNYVPLGDGSVRLLFADDRPFGDLDLRSGAWSSEHLCGEDRYNIDTVVKSDDTVEEYWQVRGPHKSYEAFTTLTRQASTDPPSE